MFISPYLYFWYFLINFADGSSVHLPLIRRSFENVESYLLRVSIGTPPQQVILKLDSDHEGLRVFVSPNALPSAQNRLFDHSLTSDRSVVNPSDNSRDVDISIRNQIAEINAQIPPNAELFSSSDFLSSAINSESSFYPEKSTSALFCTSPDKCLPGLLNGTYNCVPVSANPKDAQYIASVECHCVILLSDL